MLRSLLLFFSALFVLAGCGREEPAPSVEAQQQVEGAAEARKPLSDEGLTEIVRSALLSESSLDPRKIDIENRTGDITLRGSVATEEQKEKAARIVASVGGVRSVNNELTVDASASIGGTVPPGPPPAPLR